MICTKCMAVNDNEDRFCFKCGAPLSVGAENHSAPEDAANDSARAQNEAASYATINAKTMLAAREARKSDIAAMRPLTRAAYNIAESDNSSAISALINILYVLLGLGTVATLIKIFETISKLGQSFSTSGIEGTVSEVFYGQASTDNAQLLIWLILLFVVAAVGFICCGKLSIRLKKVNRKRKKEQLDSRL